MKLYVANFPENNNIFFVKTNVFNLVQLLDIVFFLIIWYLRSCTVKFQKEVICSLKYKKYYIVMLLITLPHDNST